MTDTISYRPALLQHGKRASTFDGIATVYYWLPFTVPDAGETKTFNMQAGDVYSQVYDFEIEYDAERGLSIDQRNFYTQASQSLYFRLTLPTNLTSPVSTLSVFYHTSPTHELWGTSALPYPDASQDTDAQAIDDPILSSSTAWVLNGSTYDLVIDLDFNTRYGSRPEESIQKLTKDREWNGYLVLTFPSAAQAWQLTTSNFDRGFLQGQYVPFYSGWDGHPAERGRPTTDMKMGTPAFAEDLSEDGYFPGIWTGSQSWDPIDPRDIRTAEASSEEGRRKDDVPA